jgi:hypothetical protein
LGMSHLVPIELAEPTERFGGIVLNCSTDELEALPPVEEFTYLRLGEVATHDPEWDVGVSDVLALPYYDSTGLTGPVDAVGDMGVAYDRVPKGEVELRRASRVLAADGSYIGDVDGFLVDDEDNITHFVLERGHLWGRRGDGSARGGGVGAVGRRRAQPLEGRSRRASVAPRAPLVVMPSGRQCHCAGARVRAAPRAPRRPSARCVRASDAPPRASAPSSRAQRVVARVRSRAGAARRS